MKYLLFSGSLRTESLNKKLIRVTESALLKNAQNSVTVIDLRELEIPVYDGDIESRGIPVGVQKLGAAVTQADAVVISSPEHNGAMSGVLKNTIDWLSRLRPVPLEAKPMLLLGATPGALAAIRALTTSKVPFETLGSFIYPLTFGLAKAHEAFSSEEKILVDPAQQKRLEEILSKFESYASALIKR